MRTLQSLLVLSILLTGSSAYSQVRPVNATAGEERADTAGTKDIEFERPLNFFASAGVGYRMATLYDVAISPIDYTVQMESVRNWNSRISLGLVWNPFKTNPLVRPDSTKTQLIRLKNKWKEEILRQSIEVARNNLAFALLLNVYQFSFSGNQSALASLIDVGAGLGVRRGDLLVLGTIEFTPYRQPRQYFIEGFKGKNKPLTYMGSADPVRTVSVDDNSLFLTKLCPFLGVKIAYAFTNNDDKKVVSVRD